MEQRDRARERGKREGGRSGEKEETQWWSRKMEKQREWKLKVRFSRKLELKEIKVIRQSQSVKRSKVRGHAETLQLCAKPCCREHH